MPPIKAIFFDAAGVFYDRRETTSALLRRRLAEFGLPLELAPAQAARHRTIYELATEGRIGHAAYWDERLRLHGLTDSAPRARLSKEIIDHNFDVFGYPGGRAAMAGLRSRGFILGLVTDTIYPVEWKIAWLDKVGVAEFFTVVACSTVVGAHKPRPEMYLNAVGQAGLTPAESAFVGHDVGELAGARRAGLVTVAVNYDPEARADYFVESLPALLDVPIFAAAGIAHSAG